MSKYVASDIDGTILPFYSDELPEELIKSVHKFQDKTNNKFTVCTGRGFHLTIPYVEKLKITLPIIINNGASLYDPVKKEFFGEEFLPIEMINDFERIAKNVEDVRWSYSCKNGWVLTDNCDNKRYYDELASKSNMKIDFLPFDKFFKKIKEEQIYQFGALFGTNDPEIDGLIKDLESAGYEVTQTKNAKRRSLEIYRKGVDKYKGIQKFAQYIGEKDLDKIVVCGDNNNDLPMLKNMKHSFAVENGADTAKKAANKGIIDSVDNNGVGKLLEKIINGEY